MQMICLIRNVVINNGKTRSNKLESHKRKEDHKKLTVSVASTLSKIENIVSELTDTEKSSGSVPIKKLNLCKSIVSGRQNNKQSLKIKFVKEEKQFSWGQIVC